MQWKTLNNFKFQISNFKGNSESELSELTDVLLDNRGIITDEDRQAFIHPSLENVTPESLGVNIAELHTAYERITTAITNQEMIVVYGDYDVDGVCGTCILYEALKSAGANVLPFIPHRVDEGYGLSLKGIDHVLSEEKTKKTKLIITVDNGILAHYAIDYAKQKGIDVIVTDHHELPETMPNAYAIVHTTQVCGTGVGWILASSIAESAKGKGSSAINHEQLTTNYLDLLALATIADIMPLIGVNRALVKRGIEVLRNTTRPGLRALFREAEIEPQKIDAYTIGHVITPRINAMGRLESAMDSLRLLCTKSLERATDLAHLLGETNRGRQLLTQAATMHAIERVKGKGESVKRIIILESDYEEGIIGLVAGKLVETFSLPAIVLSIGPSVSKASARSIPGFNIIEFIRLHEEHLINAGGHTMAAGFTVETSKIDVLKQAMESRIETYESHVVEKELVIDCDLPLESVNEKLLKVVQFFSPYGNANPEPVFESSAIVKDCKVIGKDSKHLKLSLLPVILGTDNPRPLDAIGFGLAEKSKSLKFGDKIQIAYTVTENEWNNKKSLQLIVKDIHVPSLVNRV